MKKIPLFKIRCSAIGKIMSETRGKSVAQKIAELSAKIQDATQKRDAIRDGLISKSKATARIEKMESELVKMMPYKDAPNLSQTCITYLEKWANEYIYERRIDFTSKTTDKGNLVEDDAIIYACGHIKEMGLSSKNPERFRDDFMEGEPDVLATDYVFDTKCSWSHDTFPLYATEIPESDYDWQVKGYMHLTGRKFGRIVFVLMSMPEEMLQREARWKLGPDFSRQDYEDFTAQFRYDDLPPYLRIKEFEVLQDDEAIDAIKARVLECRKYIAETIVPQIESNIKKYTDND